MTFNNDNGEKAVHVCIPGGTHDAEISRIRSVLGECQRLWEITADSMVDYAVYAARTYRDGKSVEDVLHACILNEGGAVDFYRLCEIRLRQRVKSETVTVDGK